MNPGALAPTKRSSEAAGFDLYRYTIVLLQIYFFSRNLIKQKLKVFPTIFSAEDKSIEAGGRVTIRTGLRIKPPAGCYARVAPCSELACRCYCVDIGGGVGISP